jgi:hypothetical protein
LVTVKEVGEEVLLGEETLPCCWQETSAGKEDTLGKGGGPMKESGEGDCGADVKPGLEEGRGAGEAGGGVMWLPLGEGWAWELGVEAGEDEEEGVGEAEATGDEGEQAKRARARKGSKSKRIMRVLT